MKIGEREKPSSLASRPQAYRLGSWGNAELYGGACGDRARPLGQRYWLAARHADTAEILDDRGQVGQRAPGGTRLQCR